MSKRRSAANRPPPDITLCLDENLQGNTIFNRIRNADIPVERQQDHFPRGISDEKLLEGLSGKPGWYLVTRDRDFRYRPSVRKILLARHIGVFILASVKAKRGEELADNIIAAWPRIRKFVARTPLPFVAKITGDGRVSLFGTIGD